MSGFLTREEIVNIFRSFNSKDNSSSAKQLMRRKENQLVWIKNEDYKEDDETNSTKPFYQATVIADDGDKSILKLAPGEECMEPKFRGNQFELPNTHVMDYSEMAEKGIKDMIDIDELNHATILYNLFQRYRRDDIYTYVGPTLLAVNPFKRDLNHKYPEDQILEMYQQILKASEQEFHDLMKKLEPHTYAISAYALKQMLISKNRQAIVISGESGAGKTVSAKQCMFFLTSLGKDSGKNEPTVGDRILDTNPVLEAFGNSKTARNNNSSRFGKYVKLYFDTFQGQVQGAEIKNYLLEKSRVVKCTNKERNYHIFFFMMRGCSKEMADYLGFSKPNGQRKDFPDFNYMQICSDIPNPDDDKTEYEVLMKSFTNLGFTQEEVKAIHRVTAACLFCGQLDIKDTYDDRKDLPCTITNMDVMKHLCKLLGVTKIDWLVTEIMNKQANPDQVDKTKDRTPQRHKNVIEAVLAMAKRLYDNMFNWLVGKLNVEILPSAKKSGDPSEEERFDSTTKTIGLLDIFGFENFQDNDFEQLCINYVNEKLHNLYISSVFGEEKKEMTREGLVDVVLNPPPLKVLDVLRMLDNSTLALGPQGMFQLISDKSSGVSFVGDGANKQVEELYTNIIKSHGNCSVFEKPKGIIPKNGPFKFKILHSAKTVTYTSDNFIEKNADGMSPSLDEFLQTQCDPIVNQIYLMDVPGRKKDQKKGNDKSIWAKFRLQIIELMNELAEPLIPSDFNPDRAYLEAQAAKQKKKQTEPDCEKCDLHFIRCLKPNDVKIADFFVHAMTLQQITYMGVLESIKVKQENYPYRKTFEDFYKQYELLSDDYANGKYSMMTAEKKMSINWRQRTEDIITKVFSAMAKEEFINFYAMGKTKILQMNEIKSVLDASKQKASLDYDRHSKLLKRSYKMVIADQEMEKRMKAVIKLQRAMKRKYLRIQVKRAKVVQAKLKDAITKFKTKIRFQLESDAAVVISNVYHKHVFRDKLFQAIQSRQFVKKGIFDLATINRCRKMWICRKIINQIVDDSFHQIKLKKEQNAVYRVQRIIRGHMERSGKEKIVLGAVRAKVELRQHVSAKKIQKKLKGLIVRRRLHYLSQQVSKIQATMRMKWTRRVFQVIRKNVLILQKAYRRYMARRDKIKERLCNYLKQELQVLENVKAMEYAQLYGNLESRAKAQRMGLLKSLTPYSIKKIHFFNRVVDLDILVDLSDIYSIPWSSQWLKALGESTQSETPILTVKAGQSHTLIINSKQKVFVWGWNDNGQCAKPFDQNEIVLNQPSIKNAQVNLDHIEQEKAGAQNSMGLRIKQGLAVQDRTILLLQDSGQLITWGSNDKGQLGLGHYQDVNTPTKIDIFEKLGVKVNCVAAGGDLNLCCSEDGFGFAWPFNQNGIKHSLPSKMPFSEKTKIQKVTCGHNFGFFISYQGLVYSFGEDNSDGQLGLGHTYPTEYPELITSFRDIGEKIESIECGFNHSIAKSSLGKVYTWGSSSQGQLGHGHFNSELSPRPLLIDRKNNKKVAQIAAGYSHTMVMVENNKEIFWFGTCGNLTEQTTPIAFDLVKYMPDLFGSQMELDKESFDSYGATTDFAIVKISSSWSKTMSLSNILIADLRAVNQDVTHSKLISTLKTLSQQWDPNDVMPPYIDIISNFFPANIMRKNPNAPPKSSGQFGPKNTAKKPGTQILNTSAYQTRK